MLKNITLSAEEQLIDKARKKAQQEHTTLNANFRQWLRQYVMHSTRTADFFQFMSSLNYAKPGRKFSRDELNER
ncbi:hypothetical protein GF348_24305 [candidate division KSB3 bacterium]|nr:hypothetical protein [candidate division KSB3 bacterium]